VVSQAGSRGSAETKAGAEAQTVILTRPLPSSTSVQIYAVLRERRQGIQVRFDHLVPLLRSVLQDALQNRDRGVVHKDRDGTKTTFDRRQSRLQLRSV